MPEAYTKDRYLISTDPSKLDVGQIHEFLTTSYWAAGISREAVQKAIQNSLCFGIYCGSLQIGFAESSRTTYALAIWPTFLFSNRIAAEDFANG